MALLEITDLTQRFGGLLAVNELSVRLEGREMCALIGPNGAGKTTVFNLVSGFYQPTSGSIKIGGVDTRELSSQTMESKQPGLYFIGEVADITGWPPSGSTTCRWPSFSISTPRPPTCFREK